MKRLTPIPALLAAALAQAAPVSYQIDPMHTYPSFEADHMGLSFWRGKLTKNTGSIVFDKADGSGSVDVQMNLAAIDFGLAAMNDWARGKEFLNVDKNPTASFKGRFAGDSGGMPARLVGELTLNGQTRPVTLAIHRLKCIPHPLYKRELCGADASGHFNREDFGLTAGKDWGFDMDVQLRIQVEAIAKE
ncbi:YceI family protein [Roseateles saccharophilus]|uniref:Polyisoprenoid-binding protein YceI n=1 Tax=Roseateles saccharophilus TaxID=304 RepID=A0A4R3UFW4_ROSSA|nr:YceI family protein [Roseateles saccharophilus]MDG0835897.1 polyisoprenoid-binding protein [Roseateles saccharophilus]TCU89675.1 polyisoprenoid-binding protein YceI [Roseateles saccharophilus]